MTVANYNEGTDFNLQPNLFELQGYDIQITYSTTSITGQPLFNYSDRVESLTFSGNEIVVEDTGLGQIVTVQLKSNRADEGIESITLLIPIIQMAEAQSIMIQTLAVLSKQAVFVAPGARQLQTYHPIYLSGTAQAVAF
ncbi:MAG: hypothetical protein HC781_22580 [Leptolyngbyaceae cyanobacterium CSU_1_4]|nr:hypothetical protein [Leptolyngbyaceae cyanobacterium CSU_1_4]